MSSTESPSIGANTDRVAPALTTDFERLLPQARLLGSRSDLAFRTLLDTTSRPGLIGRFVDAQFAGIPFVLLPVLALANVDTRVAVVGEAGTTGGATEADGWQMLVCRATDAQPAKPTVADIVTVTGHLDVNLVSSLRPGTPEKPEHGARLVLTCDALLDAGGPMSVDATAFHPISDDDVVVLELDGPGVNGSCRIVVVGVPAEAFEQLARINAQPSCGIDVHLVEPTGRTVALPRSTRLTVVRSNATEAAVPSN